MLQEREQRIVNFQSFWHSYSSTPAQRWIITLLRYHTETHLQKNLKLTGDIWNDGRWSTHTIDELLQEHADFTIPRKEYKSAIYWLTHLTSLFQKTQRLTYFAGHGRTTTRRQILSQGGNFTITGASILRNEQTSLRQTTTQKPWSAEDHVPTYTNLAIP